jgi:hypothetical protein
MFTVYYTKMNAGKDVIKTAAIPGLIIQLSDIFTK